MDNLKKRGWSGEEKYVFCLEGVETVDQLFNVTTILVEGFLPNKRFSSSKKIWEANYNTRGGALPLRKFGRQTITQEEELKAVEI